MTLLIILGGFATCIMIYASVWAHREHRKYSKRDYANRG